MLTKQCATCRNILSKAETDLIKSSSGAHIELLVAAHEGYTKIVDLLVRAGVDVNRKNRHSSTALMRSASPSKPYSHSTVMCVKILLKGGAQINLTNKIGINALSQCLLASGIRRGLATKQESIKAQEVAMVLYAAGEIIDGTTVERKERNGSVTKVPVPDYLLHDDLKLNLKHLCRETIRKHLLAIALHENLFGRIPRLGLPSSLAAYLLNNVSLDED